MSSTRLLPLFSRAIFKVYSPKNCIAISNYKYINTTRQFYNAQQGLFKYEKSRLSFSTKSAVVSSEVPKIVDTDDDNSLIVKIAKKIPFLNVNKHRLNVVGLMLYESIADNIPYNEFIEEFSLPDTFYSWFCITELHVWLLSVRCMSEAEDGRMVRNRLIEAMWTDVGQRVRQLGVGSSPLVRKQVKELSEQFQAALVSYDEGLLSDDVTFAGALWRRMYQVKQVDLDHLEILIRYIRKQIRYLDRVSTKELFSIKSFQWDFDRAK